MPQNRCFSGNRPLRPISTAAGLWLCRTVTTGIVGKCSIQYFASPKTQNACGNSAANRKSQIAFGGNRLSGYAISQRSRQTEEMLGLAGVMTLG
jgi:hypothetical protein